MKEFVFAWVVLWSMVFIPVSSWAQEDCEATPVKIHGNSLAPLVANGADIMMKPVSCAGEIRHGDFVIFESGASEMPVIKTVRAIAGDRFAIEDGYIIINGEKQQTSTGEYYRLTGGRDKMLKLYQDSFNGIVPENVFLVLGDRPHGAIDSSRIGFVHLNDIIMVGMVEGILKESTVEKEEK